MVVESKYILFLVFVIDETAGAEELGNFEQADQGWLLLHVHAFVRDWDCSPCCNCMAVNQILVIMGIITNTEQSLICLLSWCGLGFITAIMVVIFMFSFLGFSWCFVL